MSTPRFQRQTRTGAHGNCFNACVASLLGVPIETVDAELEENNWLEQMDALIHPLGYCFIEWDWDNPERPWHWVGSCYVIATGDGPRGTKHAVIAKHRIDPADGKHCIEFVWDPHPDDRYLVKIDYIGVLFPHWEGAGKGIWRKRKRK